MVEHTVRDREVASSSLAIPTLEIVKELGELLRFLMSSDRRARNPQQGYAKVYARDQEDYLLKLFL
jgi:hypothetical protein